MTPEHAELFENCVYMLVGGMGGVVFGIFLAALMGAGATSDREKAAFRAGFNFAKHEAEREAVQLVRG